MLLQSFNDIHIKDSTEPKYPVLQYPVALTVLLVFTLSGSFLAAHAQNHSVARLRILTHVINDDGGTNRSSDFSNCIDSSSGISSTTQCSSGNSLHSFDAGSYKDRKSVVRERV